MSRGGDSPGSPLEKAAEEDIACLRRLEDLGLLTFDANCRPAQLMFRLIAHMPGGYVDSDGELCDKDRWSADIAAAGDYPATRPALRLSPEQLVPDSEYFAERSAGFLSSATRIEWRMPEPFADTCRRVADLAMVFLWTINPENMAHTLLANEESFRSPPLDRLDVLPALFAQAGGLTASLPAEDAAPGDAGGLRPGLVSAEPPAEPSPAARPSRKFVIREERLDTIVATDFRPKGFELIAQPRKVDSEDIVYLTRSALEEIYDHIEWGQATERNVREQGGVLVGLRCREPLGSEEFVKITHALPVRSDERSSVYVKFDHAAWSEVLHALDVRKEEGAIDKEALIVGWYHTHPNGLDCFMSGTDRTTQQSVFHRPWNYALVLNPQRKIIASFVGPESVPCRAAILD